MSDDEREEIAEQAKAEAAADKAEAQVAEAEPVKSFPANVERQRQRILRRKVERALDEKVMQWVCTADDLDFATYGDLYEIPKAPKGVDFYIYKDNGASILAAAHLDSVEQKQRFFHVTDDARVGDIVCSPSLDDRLGAYVILELLPKLGIKTDILLTVGEEQGRSTAANFVPPTGKQYNWMFQFDRTGTDVVMYQYDSDQRRKLLRSVGAVPAYGAFSDISYLGNLGCAGFNWGVGYHDYHGPRAWASLHELILQVTRFWRFYDRYKELQLKHDANVVRGKRNKWERPSGYLPSSSYGGFTGPYGDWRARQGLENGSGGGKNGANGTGFRAANNASPNGPGRTIPDIDEQLAGRKRGSKRGARSTRSRGRRAGRPDGGSISINGVIYDAVTAAAIIEDRCPVCNTALWHELLRGGEDIYCPSCNWTPLEAPPTFGSLLGMTEDEYRRYEGRAAGIQGEMSYD